MSARTLRTVAPCGIGLGHITRCEPIADALASSGAEVAHCIRFGVRPSDISFTGPAKRESEIDPVRLRPHPWEFYLYFDV